MTVERFTQTQVTVDQPQIGFAMATSVSRLAAGISSDGQPQPLGITERGMAPSDSKYAFAIAKKLKELSIDPTITIESITQLPIIGFPADLSTQYIDGGMINYYHTLQYDRNNPTDSSPISHALKTALDAHEMTGGTFDIPQESMTRIGFLNENPTVRPNFEELQKRAEEEMAEQTPAEKQRLKELRELNKYVMLPDGSSSFPIEALYVATVEPHPNDPGKKQIRIPLIGDSGTLEAAMILILSDVQVAALQNFIQEIQQMSS